MTIKERIEDVKKRWQLQEDTRQKIIEEMNRLQGENRLLEELQKEEEASQKAIEDMKTNSEENNG